MAKHSSLSNIIKPDETDYIDANSLEVGLSDAFEPLSTVSAVHGKPLPVTMYTTDEQSVKLPDAPLARTPSRIQRRYSPTSADSASVVSSADRPEFPLFDKHPQPLAGVAYPAPLPRAKSIEHIEQQRLQAEYESQNLTEEFAEEYVPTDPSIINMLVKSGRAIPRDVRLSVEEYQRRANANNATTDARPTASQRQAQAPRMVAPASMRPSTDVKKNNPLNQPTSSQSQDAVTQFATGSNVVLLGEQFGARGESFEATFFQGILPVHHISGTLQSENEAPLGRVDLNQGEYEVRIQSAGRSIAPMKVRVTPRLRSSTKSKSAVVQLYSTPESSAQLVDSIAVAKTQQPKAQEAVGASTEDSASLLAAPEPPNPIGVVGRESSPFQPLAQTATPFLDTQVPPAGLQPPSTEEVRTPGFIALPPRGQEPRIRLAPLSQISTATNRPSVDTHTLASTAALESEASLRSSIDIQPAATSATLPDSAPISQSRGGFKGGRSESSTLVEPVAPRGDLPRVVSPRNIPTASLSEKVPASSTPPVADIKPNIEPESSSAQPSYVQPASKIVGARSAELPEQEGEEETEEERRRRILRERGLPASTALTQREDNGVRYITLETQAKSLPDRVPPLDIEPPKPETKAEPSTPYQQVLSERARFQQKLTQEKESHFYDLRRAENRIQQELLRVLETAHETRERRQDDKSKGSVLPGAVAREMLDPTDSRRELLVLNNIQTINNIERAAAAPTIEEGLLRNKLRREMRSEMLQIQREHDRQTRVAQKQMLEAMYDKLLNS